MLKTMQELGPFAELGVADLQRSRRKMANTAFDRRQKARIYLPFPAVVEGVNTSGEHFKVNTVLDNLSKEGLYLRLFPCVTQGSEISVVFRFSTSAVEPSSPRVSIKGTVLRVEERPGGACGVAVQFKSPRFM
jgi:hypothetical protein